ncbi:hypothetical protein [Bradyrhizobium tunisiense]|uniref:hypothetical protein n=1 Tax=Bradyrhizobium tunisiense TaxID=3278709 RepID=UPI0035E0733E
MAASLITVVQLDRQLAAARDRLSELEQDARDLALPAVSGDQDAVASLASANSSIGQIRADLIILERARASVVEQQRQASEADATAYRARHLEIAQDRAAEIVKLAARADELVAEFKRVFAGISATEREIWMALNEASAPPSDAVVGRKNLGNFVMASLTAFTNGTDRFGQTRAVADVAAKAWADLLSNDDI